MSPSGDDEVSNGKCLILLLLLQQKQLKLGDKMDLWSYLLKPVQRVSKYSLLLQDLMVECGPGQAKELAEVKAALEVIHLQLRHGNNLLAMDAIQHCDVRQRRKSNSAEKKDNKYSMTDAKGGF